MREAELERKVVKWCREHGLLTYKFVSPSSRGVPDRIVICPGGGILFLELKQPGSKPTALQLHEIDRLQIAGCNARWSDNYADIISILTEFCPQ
jgi:hypothetical protein